MKSDVGVGSLKGRAANCFLHSGKVKRENQEKAQCRWRGNEMNDATGVQEGESKMRRRGSR